VVLPPSAKPPVPVAVPPLVELAEPPELVPPKEVVGTPAQPSGVT
jgi:hypothetical protein